LETLQTPKVEEERQGSGRKSEVERSYSNIPSIQQQQRDAERTEKWRAKEAERSRRKRREGSGDGRWSPCAIM